MQIPFDEGLLRRFKAEVGNKVPHLVASGGEAVVANPTPLVDVTETLAECARLEYGMSPDWRDARVFAKFDSKIFGGSVKVRPAVKILEDAISSGKLVGGQTIFEATSGNFGLALGRMHGLGFEVVALVSRKVQQGVHEQLKEAGVKSIDLDVDICPAPGFQGDADLLAAKGVLASVREQLAGLGFDPKRLDESGPDALKLLASQDAIGLAGLLARAYGGFCPQQYDNELNAGVHEAVTGPELDQQLGEVGLGLGEVELVCTFGTGGTATGISRYAARRHGTRVARVVFPLSGQDVAGIRTKDKAAGLKFYRPGEYLGEHELDFDQARRLLRFFNARDNDVGESGALALYACLQMLNFGPPKKYVVIVADGASKYGSAKGAEKEPRSDQVTLEQASARISEYASVLWTHSMLVPREEGVEVISKSLGCGRDAVRVADVKDVQAVVNGMEPSQEFGSLLPSDGRPVLLVCMAGNTSLMVARALGKKGVAAESLVGGIGGLPLSRAKGPFGLVQAYRG
jgi:cysteine synthase